MMAAESEIMAFEGFDWSVRVCAYFFLIESKEVSS